MWKFATVAIFPFLKCILWTRFKIQIWSFCSPYALLQILAKVTGSQYPSLFTQTKSYSAPLTKAAKSFMFCQHLIPPVPLAICLPPDNRGRRMAADCWNAPQWNQLLHVDCVHHGRFERTGLIQFGTAGFPLKKSYPFDCLYFWAFFFFFVSLSLFTPTAINGSRESGCSLFHDFGYFN